MSTRGVSTFEVRLSPFATAPRNQGTLRAMSVQPDGTSAPRSESDAAAHRRWLITIIITVVFGGFGAVMAYLSYVNSSKPSATSPGRSRSPSKTSTTAPTAAPTVAPPAAEPSDPAPSDKGKDHKDNK